MSIAEDVHALRYAAGAVDCSDRSFVQVVGPDAQSFLQSLVSADIDALGDGRGAASLLLQPQGKLEVAFRILIVGSDAWLDTDPGMGAHLKTALDRFRIRVKAEVIDQTGVWSMLSVRGPDTEAALGVPIPGRHVHVPWSGTEAVRMVGAGLPDLPGVDLIGPGPAIEAARAVVMAGTLRACGRDALEILRIEERIPRHGAELDDHVIPQEAFLEREAVSFTKGCFVGQELVCRIDSRGHVNRFLRRMSVQGETVPAVGANIVAESKVVGTVTSAARSPELGVLALGFIRRELDLGAFVEIDGVGSALLSL